MSVPALQLVPTVVDDEETPFDHADVTSPDLTYVAGLQASTREWCLVAVGLGEALGVPLEMATTSPELEALARLAIVGLQERAINAERELAHLSGPRQPASEQDLATANAFIAFALRDPAAAARMINARGWVLP